MSSESKPMLEEPDVAGLSLLNYTVAEDGRRVYMTGAPIVHKVVRTKPVEGRLKRLFLKGVGDGRG